MAPDERLTSISSYKGSDEWILLHFRHYIECLYSAISELLSFYDDAINAADLSNKNFFIISYTLVCLFILYILSKYCFYLLFLYFSGILNDFKRNFDEKFIATHHFREWRKAQLSKDPLTEFAAFAPPLYE